MTAKAADAPSAKLRRVLRGQAVGAITLPDDNRILVDGRPGPDDRYLVVRLNANRCLCWMRTQRAQHIKGWLQQANGQIETASSRVDCYRWPSRWESLNTGGLDV